MMEVCLKDSGVNYYSGGISQAFPSETDGSAGQRGAPGVHGVTHQTQVIES